MWNTILTSKSVSTHRFTWLSILAAWLLLTSCSLAKNSGRPFEESPIALSTPTPVLDPQDPCLTLDEIQLAGREEIARLESFCYRLPNGAEMTINQVEDIRFLRSMLPSPNVQLWFQEVGYAPNAPTSGYLVVVYTDEIGKSYMLDPSSRQIVEITPGQGEGGAVQGQPELSSSELQAIAENFIIRNTPQFASDKKHLSFRGGEKGGENYFFRWEDLSTGEWENMPPLVQVGITVNGHIFSYINTLYLPSYFQ